jgi:hypothetical protein
VRGQWVSDTDVLADYADNYLARSSPWTEVLGTVGVGPLRVETDTFQHWETYDVQIDSDETKEYTQPLPALQRPLGAVLSFSGIPIGGPVAASVLARSDVFVDGFGIDQLVGSARARFEGDAELTAGQEVGAFRFAGAVRGRAVDYQSDDPLDPLDESDPWTTGTAAASAVVSTWGDHGALRHLLDLGIAGSLGATGGEPVEWVPADEPPPDTVLGPVVDSAWLSAGGVPLRVHVALPWVEGVMEPNGTLRLALGPWHSTITADRHLQEGNVGRGDAVGRFDVGLARTDELLQARGTFVRSVPALSWLHVGYGGLYDLDGEELLWHGPTLRYVSPCRCLTAGASAVWSIDQTVPQLRFQLELL